MKANKQIDIEFLMLMSPNLDRFMKKKANLFAFRCPSCNDSQKDKNKARGYVYEDNGKMWYKCHNCGIGFIFGNFLKRFAPALHKEYIIKTLKHNALMGELPDSSDDTFKEPKRYNVDGVFKSLNTISSLKHTHPAKIYVQNRKIPNEYHHQLYLCLKFKAFVNSILPDKFDNIDNDEPRLIIPLLDVDGSVIGFQGRSFKKKTKLRYITIILNKTRPKLFGLDKIDSSKGMYVLEGPIDSMFLPNALAMVGADISSLKILSKDNRDFTFIYDNEPRNTEIVKRMAKTIDEGYKIAILPNSFDKDVNLMIMDGMSKDKVKQIIDDHTYEGITAKIKFTEWKRR